MRKLRALIVGECVPLLIAMPSLINRSGFDVDIICTNPILKKSRFVANSELASNHKDILDKLASKDLSAYDIIIPCDDNILKIILNSNFTTEEKLKLLPVQNKKNFEHIFSKIGLSKILSEANITTPAFANAQGYDTVVKAAEEIGYPLMIKIDSSNSGTGTFECENLSDLQKISPQVFDSPILIQKKIIGQELDLSGFYRDGKLIFFTYSEIKKVSENKFGPSVVRLYHQLGSIDEKIFLEMEQLGKALGANGFVTISCMESSEDKKRYFIEADMRPNSWVQFGKFFGDDPAKKISKWFLDREDLQHPIAINKKYPAKLLMPYFYRMSPSEILSNQYNVWKFLPMEDYKLLFHLLYAKSENKRKIISEKRKIFLKMIKHIPTKLCRLIIKNKEHRIKIRTKLKQVLQFFINKLYIFKKAV